MPAWTTLMHTNKYDVTVMFSVHVKCFRVCATALNGITNARDKDQFSYATLALYCERNKRNYDLSLCDVTVYHYTNLYDASRLIEASCLDLGALIGDASTARLMARGLTLH
jgi:hypothetical protein